MVETSEKTWLTGEGNGKPLQYSCLENPMDRGASWAIVHGVSRVRHDLATKPPNLIKQNLVCTRTQEKGAMIPQETDPDLPVCVQESLAEAWVSGGLLQDWAL